MIGRLLASIIVLGLAVGAARADSKTIASFNGSACVPGDATLRFDRHRVDNGSVRHASSNVDLIVLTCGITPVYVGVAASDNVLRLIYQDSTGISPSAFVRAQLYRLPIETEAPDEPFAPLPAAAVATPRLVVQLNSNEAENTGLSIIGRSFEHEFNFEENIYWIRIEMDRSSTSQTVILHAVYIWNDGGGGDG